jgi:hypothetical protein
VPLAGQLHLLLTHMEQFEAEGLGHPDAPPIPHVLAGVLVQALARLARERPGDLAVAADLLDAVSRAVEEEIFVLPIPREEPLNGGCGARPRR